MFFIRIFHLSFNLINKHHHWISNQKLQNYNRNIHKATENIDHSVSPKPPAKQKKKKFFNLVFSQDKMNKCLLIFDVLEGKLWNEL